MQRCPRIPMIHRDHFLDCAPPGYDSGRKLAKLWRAWRRSGRVLVTGRWRTPFTDGMCQPYHGGWVSNREVYVMSWSGRRYLGKLYDKGPPPPLSLGQRQRIAAALAALGGES